MNIKKIYGLFFIYLVYSTACLSHITNPAHHEEFHSMLETIDEEDDFFDQEEMQKLECYTAKTAIQALLRTPCNPPIDETIIVGADDILREDIYQRTNPITQRPLQDYPQFYFNPCLSEHWQWFAQFFYNHTNRAYFTQNGNTIASYLAFNNVDLITKVSQLGFANNIQELIALFAPTKLEERRSGFMLGFVGSKYNWILELKIPLYYLERNFFLTPQEKKAINDFLLAEDDPEGEMAFARKHLISDKIGFGDTRIYISTLARDSSSMLLNTGFLATIPTAFSLVRGIYGSHFPQNNKKPSIDLIELLNLATHTPLQNLSAVEIITNNFFLAALDKLSSNLLENGMGNRGHLGLGLFFNQEMYVSPRLTFLTRAELEYLLPGTERRFYILKKDQAAFDKLENPDPNNCVQDIQFLQEQLINTLFPSVLDTVVYPGFIFKFSTAFVSQMSKRWDFSAGYDLWWQQQEKLGKIISTPSLRALARKDIATRSNAMAHKLFASFIYSHEGTSWDWCLSFNGDYTFLNAGIGKDYMISTRFEILY